MVFSKNQLITLDITDISHEGEGIGKVDGFPFFVKDTVPGDHITAKVMKTKKTYGYARLEVLLEPSQMRVEPVCAYHKACGGCQLQSLSYEHQLAFKQQKVYNNLLRIGGLSEELLDRTMEPIVGMDEPFHYRNKAQYPVGKDKDGNPITGFYAGRTHSIIANTQCYLGKQENQDILERVLSYMKKNHIAPYDETNGMGLIRHILIRTGFTSGQIMVCLVVNMTKAEYERGTVGGAKTERATADKRSGAKGCVSDDKLAISELISALKDVPGMTSISLNFNTRRDNVIMGDEVACVWGEPVIEDSLHTRDVAAEFERTGEELKFHISPLSFYQVNPEQTEKLYSIALDYAALTGKESVWDLYCGIGTISLFLSQRAGKVYGVEVIPQAIDDARANARRNGIENVEFFVGKAEEVLPEFYERNRSGLTDGVAGAGVLEDDKSPRVELAGADAIGDGGTELLEGDKSSKVDGASAGKLIEVQADDKSSVNDVAGALAGDKSPNSMLHPEVIVVDPPRKGCDSACLDTMLKMQPDRIVYVSCDSATLARDVKYLCEGGYELKKWCAVDQFGMTVHCETVVLLSQQKADDYIEIELDLEELDLTSAESKASYREIKDYIFNKYNTKVSTLYIAQIKRKCGLELGINYNPSQKENARVPKCPLEKERYIMDALTHFQMV